MSSGLESAELNQIDEWICICGFKTVSADRALDHIIKNHDGKPVIELTKGMK
uniref:C2H2-type domain-containing protein n=1 Tax=viral metagenome TaxID=1070528 RepID=A0A6M3M8E4_9ZZZZ